MKLSIILTVYNKAPYLHRAFDALLNQEGAEEDEYEVLVVNDGSTDNSATIIDEYAHRDNRVRVFAQTNQGLSMARNNGTDAAKGEYVWYVDADDIISKNAVRLLCAAIESQPDVIPIYAQDEGIDKARNCVPVTVNTGVDVLLSRKWEQCGVFWILRRDFLKENDLKFYPAIYHEDAEFTPRMLYVAKSVKLVPEVLYTIIHEPNSITGTPRPKRAFDCLVVAERLYDFAISKHLDKEPVGIVFFDEISMMLNNGLFIITKNSKENKSKFNKALKAKKQILEALKHSGITKYRIEYLLFSMCFDHYVQTYKLQKLI